MTLNKNLLTCINCFPDDIHALPRSNDYKLYCTDCWKDKVKMEDALREVASEKKYLERARENWKNPEYIALLSEQDYKETIAKFLRRATRYAKRLASRRSGMRKRLNHYTGGIVN